MDHEKVGINYQMVLVSEIEYFQEWPLSPTNANYILSSCLLDESVFLHNVMLHTFRYNYTTGYLVV